MQSQLRKTIRNEMKSTRLLLAQEERSVLSLKATQHLLAHLNQEQFLSDAQHIALFQSFAGEINTQFAIESLWQLGKNVYLPVLHPFNVRQLLFLNYQTDTELIQNRFGIWEPKLTLQSVKPIQQIDVFVMPLTAFDRQGARLGMGGGFYDYSLNRCDRSRQTMIGFAYAWQEVPFLPTEPWDLTLDYIVTDLAVIESSQTRAIR